MHGKSVNRREGPSYKEAPILESNFDQPQPSQLLMSCINSKNFYHAYSLAGKVKAKLVADADDPKTGLRNLVVQANMLDNLMKDIDDYTAARYMQHQLHLREMAKNQKLATPQPQKPQLLVMSMEIEDDDETDSDDEEAHRLDDSLDDSDDSSSEEEYSDAAQDLSNLAAAVAKTASNHESYFREDDLLYFEENYIAA